MKVIVILLVLSVALLSITGDNKMSAVSLSIVFGPNVFRYVPCVWVMYCNVCVAVCIQLCICNCMYVCVAVCMHMWLCVYICVYSCVYVCMYCVCACVCVRVCAWVAMCNVGTCCRGYGSGTRYLDIFDDRCEGGLAGLQRQGVCNSFLSKMIMKCDKMFMVCARYPPPV